MTLNGHFPGVGHGVPPSRWRCKGVAGMKLSQLAQTLGLEQRGMDVEVTGVAPADEAGPGTLAFAGERKHLAKANGAGALILTEELAHGLERPLLVSRAPALDLARAAPLLGHRAMGFVGVDPAAVIHPSAQLGEGVAVGARAVIGAEAVIGPGCIIHPGAIIHERCILGARCVIQSNAVIGSEGFAYEFVGGRHQPVPHFGIARLEDDVEVGACTTVDRARFGETLIGAGTKIDNQVQIAHNVHIGRHCIIVAQVGIAGSCTIGDGVVLAGQVGVVPHVTIGRGARLAASTGVANDVPEGATFSGWWGKDHRRSMIELSSMGKLPEFMKEVRAFMKRFGGE